MKNLRKRVKRKKENPKKPKMKNKRSSLKRTKVSRYGQIGFGSITKNPDKKNMNAPVPKTNWLVMISGYVHRNQPAEEEKLHRFGDRSKIDGGLRGKNIPKCNLAQRFPAHSKIFRGMKSRECKLLTAKFPKGSKSFALPNIYFDRSLINLLLFW